MIIFTLLLFVIATILAQKTKIPKEKDRGGYLIVYFKDDTHGLCKVLSKDGYSVTDVNNAKLIIASDTIVEPKGDIKIKFSAPWLPDANVAVQAVKKLKLT